MFAQLGACGAIMCMHAAVVERRRKKKRTVNGKIHPCAAKKRA